MFPQFTVLFTFIVFYSFCLLFILALFLFSFILFIFVFLPLFLLYWFSLFSMYQPKGSPLYMHIYRERESEK